MHRNKQVSQELMKVISGIIPQVIAENRFGLVTVTDIVVTTGLERATIFISALRHGRTAAKELNKKSSKIREMIGRKVQLRKIPQLSFEFDISNERTEQIEQLMREKGI